MCENLRVWLQIVPQKESRHRGVLCHNLPYSLLPHNVLNTKCCRVEVKKKKSPQEKNVQCVGSVGWRHKARESECMCGWEHERTAATVPGVRSTKNCNDFFTELLQMEEAETKRTMFLTISEKMKIYFGWKKKYPNTTYLKASHYRGN